MKDLGFYVFLGMMVTFGAIALLCAKISDWCHTYIHTYIHTYCYKSHITNGYI